MRHLKTSIATGALRRRDGFALIIVVSLLALLVLAMVSLATLTRIETQVGANSRKYAQARQNARFALEQALGNLQRHAGPDTRITTTGGFAGVTNANKHWTGVWPSAGGSAGTWLVSGNENGTMAYDPNASIGGLSTSSSALSDGVTVNDVEGDPTPARVLVGPNTADDSDAANFVLAPVIPLEGPVAGESSERTVGRYAWWVGDEGVKASINDTEWHDEISYDDLPDIYSGSSGSNGARTRARLVQLAMPRSRAQAIYPGVNSTNPTTESQLRRVLTSNQFSFVDGAPLPSIGRADFHDATVVSRGVIVDTARGGLKADLSAPGSHVESSLTAFLGKRPISVNGTGTVARYPIARDASGGWIAPVLTEATFQIQFEPWSAARVPTVASWEVELWNPYNVELTLVPLEVRVVNPGDLSLSGSAVHLPRTMSDNEDTSNFYRAQILAQSATPAEWQGKYPVGKSVLLPGEVVRISSGVQSGDACASDGQRINPGSGAYSLDLDVVNVAGVGSTRFELRDLNNNLIIASYRPRAASDSSTLGTGYVVHRMRLLDTRDPADGDETGPLAQSWLALVDPRAPGIQDFGGSSSLDVAPFDGTFPSARVQATAASAPPAHMLEPGGVCAPFDLPVQRMVSVGGLQHFGFAEPVSSTRNSPAFRLGNALGATITNPIDNSGVIDANSLFDRAYFSTLPTSVASSWSPGRDPLPNSRVVVFEGGYAVPVTLSDLVSLAVDDNDQKPASRLMVRGAFNVNCPSSKAWRALVWGTRIEQWTYGDDATASTTDTHALSHAYFRLPQTGQSVGIHMDNKPASASSGWRQGVRELSDADVNAIADYIAAHVDDPFAGIKLAGEPFRSLADFVNSGVVQSAIDSVASINSGLDRLSPGYLTQAELLSAWAPFIQARSDTFTVRAYGEVINPALDPDGNGPLIAPIEARAWCEAIVQRIPDYVDIAEPAWTTPPSRAANVQFGRRFVITSFRWLSPDDI